MTPEQLRKYNCEAQRRSRARTAGSKDPAVSYQNMGRKRKTETLGDGEIFSAGNPDPRPSVQMIAEAKRRRSFIMTLETELMGDPPPGQSALDKSISL